METILVSLCAFGVPCRYHGKTHKMGHELYKKRRTDELRMKYNILPLCGEQMGGLPTPRPGCDVIGERVVSRYGGCDFTAEYEKGAESILRLCKIFDVKRAYLLKNSPMCGRGYGKLAVLLEKNGVAVYDI